MLSFVQSWFTAGANPVGVDFGTECLRLAQVEKINGDCRLIAAASIEVPPGIRHDATARSEFFSSKLHELWAKGNFRGRRAVLALPAAGMYVQHMRLPRMDDESIKKALPWETQGKLPIDPADAVLRHLVAGDIYANHEPQSEVIVLAAQRKLVDGLLESATKARLDVVGMNVEPLALIECFLHIYRRQSDTELTNCFVDIGSTGSRAVIARAGQIFFVRNLPIGGKHLNEAVAAELKISDEEARTLRFRAVTPANHATADAASTESFATTQDRRDVGKDHDLVARETSSHSRKRKNRESSATAVATLEPTPAAILQTHSSDQTRIDHAIREPVSKLAEELLLCRRYHEATFPDNPIQRLIFVGGEARNRELCQQVARKVGISAQIGDPLVRMGRTTDVGIDSGIDRRQPQPAWAVAIGLSMGPLGGNTP